MGQSVLRMDIDGVEKKYLPKKMSIDSASVLLSTNQILNELRENGFWLASVESVKYGEESVSIVFYQGRRFNEIHFDVRSIDSLYYVNMSVKKKPASITNVPDKLKQVLIYMENHGYPFARVLVDSSRVIDDALYLSLSLDPGMKIVFDTISINPKGILKEKFLNKYLGLDINKVYDESSVKNIPKKLENLPFIELISVNSSFALKRAKVALDVKPVKVNYFDGILGFIPNREDGKLEFTGEVNLSVKNLFRSAKAIDIHWEKVSENTQKLQASYLHPIFLGTPLDLFASFDQIKQDTLFSNRKLEIGLAYYPFPSVRVSSLYENYLGNELNDDTGQSGNFTVDNYGLSINHWNLDSRLNPRNGYSLTINSKVGKKEVNDVDLSSSSTQYAVDGYFDAYKLVLKRSVIFASISSGWIGNESLFINDLFRLGGLYSIRGFNEGDFFASEYVYSNLEWRFLMDDKSYLFAFYDQAYLGYDIISGSFDDYPSGLGLGMQFATDSGNFLMIYGMGKRKNESFSFDSSKIHFGYSALF